MATILLDDGLYYIERIDRRRGRRCPTFGTLCRRREAFARPSDADARIGVYECIAPGQWVVHVVFGIPAAVVSCGTHLDWKDAIVALWRARNAIALPSSRDLATQP
ncbi:hypothetical protein [Cupriavidus malaysiensis]|uniref:hypothetical protein n=1 Tax=Cupriavidus malaysiensis TaxID=367825 RepID=UPI0012FFA023|nr:hypothetical protein [Cupriavidus malaysiensis]